MSKAAKRTATFRHDTAKDLLRMLEAWQGKPVGAVRYETAPGHSRQCRTQIIRVAGAGRVSPDPSGLFAGTVQISAAGDLIDGGSCWIYPLAHQGTLEGGTRYIGWRVGTASDETPIFVFSPTEPPGEPLRFFLAKLSQHIGQDDSLANVEDVIALDGDGTPSIESVDNTLRCIGSKGDHVLLVEDKSDPAYTFTGYMVVQVFRDSRIYLGTLGETAHSESSSVDVTNLLPLDGGRFNNGAPSPIASLDVNNPFRLVGQAGSQCLVIEDRRSGDGDDLEYILMLVSQRVSRMYRGVLSADLASGASAVGIGSVVALDAGPAPSTVTAQNRFALAGKSGFDVYFVEDWTVMSEGQPQYLLVQVEHVEIENMPVAIRWNAGAGQLELKTRDVAVLSDADTSDWAVLFKPEFYGLTTKTFISQWRYDTASHKFQVKTIAAKVVEPGAESDWTDAYTAVQSDLISEVRMDSEHTLVKKKRSGYVLEAASETESNVVVFNFRTFVRDVYIDDGTDFYQTVFDAYVIDPSADREELIQDGTECED